MSAHYGTTMEQMYSSQQIVIPPMLAPTLKKFAKAAIRTQPLDLLIWSAAYFKALANGLPLPTKDRIEYPPVTSISGLSSGFLQILINQLGNNAIKVPKQEIMDYWYGICLSKEALDEILGVGGFIDEINWLKFLGICAGYLETSLSRTMILLCQLLTEEPNGGSHSLPINKFLYLYKYLARLDCGPESPKQKAPQQKFLRSRSTLDEILSGEDISYKDEEEIKEELVTALQATILEKEKSNISFSTIESNNIDKEEYLSRGITWKRVVHSNEERDKDGNKQSHDECDNEEKKPFAHDSTCGVEVFQHDEDGEHKKIKIPPKNEAHQKHNEEGDIINFSVKTDETISNLTELLDSIEDPKPVESEIKNLKTNSLPALDKIKSAKEKDISIPEKFDINTECSTAGYEADVVLEVDSSTILVPTPPRTEYGFPEEDTIKKVKKGYDISLKDLLEIRSATLFDVRIPNIKGATLQEAEEHKSIPVMLVKEQKWANIPGIGPKVPERQIKEVESYMRKCADKQGGSVMPRNIRHFLCPNLDFVEPGANKKNI